MSSNQIGGFFNRLEASRKYLFGSMGVLGKTNDSLISGALIARGQDIKPVVDVAPDYESTTDTDPLLVRNIQDDSDFRECPAVSFRPPPATAHLDESPYIHTFFRS